MIYRFAVRTLVVPCLVVNYVRHVLPSLASIKALVSCHVLHLVFDFHVIDAASKPFPAGINVQVSVVKIVIETTVTHVVAETKPE